MLGRWPTSKLLPVRNDVFSAPKRWQAHRRYRGRIVVVWLVSSAPKLFWNCLTPAWLYGNVQVLRRRSLGVG